jgi:putative membrane protein
MGDPRVYFAAERTLLAWIRTGLTIMALGFVVARFGLFLALLSAEAPAAGTPRPGHWPSTLLGIALVLLAVAGIGVALYNHRCYVGSLPAEDVPALAVPGLTSWIAAGVAAIGALLAVYLLMT